MVCLLKGRKSMFKKILLIISFFTVAIKAQDIEQVQMQDALDQLLYTIGMNLAAQTTIQDEVIGKTVLLRLYDQVPQVAQIIDMFLMLDQEMVDYNITSCDQLIDYEVNEHYDLAMSLIVFAASLQNVFVQFNLLHPDDASYQVWRSDIAYLGSINSEDDLANLNDYAALYEACSVMIESQLHLEYEFKALE